MSAHRIRTETVATGSLPTGCDLAVLGKMELHAGRLDGLDLRVLVSHHFHSLLAQEARATGKTPGEILGYLFDLSLYEKS